MRKPGITINYEGGKLMARTGTNIYRRKDGRWEGRYIQFYTSSGKAKYASVYAGTYREAKERQAFAISGLGGMEKTSKHPPGATFGRLLDEWLAVRRMQVSESTYVKYRMFVEKHIKPQLGDYLPRDITEGTLQQFAADALTAGRLHQEGGLSPKTVKDMLVMLHGALSYMRKKNPDLCTAKEIAYPKEPRREVRVLSSDELLALEKVLWHQMDGYKLGVLVSEYTGLQIGEVCALRWEDISLDEGVLHVRRTVQRLQDLNQTSSSKTRLVIGEPKTACSQREIPLPGFLLEELRRRYPADARAYLLTSTADFCADPRTMSNRFKRYQVEAGIIPVNYHTLRHTFATRCAELNFDVKCLSEILGHASVNITLNRYVHASMRLKRENMNRLNSASQL